MTGTAGGDSVLANVAEAVQAVMEEDRMSLPAAGAAATISPPRARQAPVIVEEEVEVAAAAGPAEKKKKHFLRTLFRRKKHAHKHNHKPTAEDLLHVMGGTTTSSTNARAGGNGSAGGRSPNHQHGPGGAAACPLHGRRPKSPAKVASPQRQQQQQVQQQQLPGTPATGRGEEGKVLSWTLPAVAATYFLVRLTVAPLVRSFSGPVGEAIVLAVLLQQVLSLLLKKNVLDAATLPSLGGVDLSHAFFASSLILALGSVVLTTLRAGTVALKHIQAPGLWERLSLSSNNETVHLVNTGLFLLVLVLIVCQPKTRKEVRRLSSARVT